MIEVKSIIGDEVYEKLIKNDITTNLSFLVTDTEELKEITGLSLEVLEETKLKIAKIVHRPNKIIKAVDVPVWRRIGTGCDGIDTLIRGGVPVNGITEIFGCSGVGKTQFCLQLALQVQLPIEKNGLEKGAVYICTEDAFPSKRFHQMTKWFKTKHGLSEIDLESAVFLKHVQDIQQLHKCLSTELPLLLRKENIGLVVVDSIAGVFRGENEGEILIRSKDILGVVKLLNMLNEEYEVAVVCTNQVTEDVVNNKTEPCLGLVWSNLINYRCQIIRYNNGGFRKFEVVFAPDVASRSCCFSINEEGLRSVDF